MPIDTIRVNDVFSRPIRNGLIEYTISADTQSFTTLDMWKAAVAKESIKTGQWLKVSSQDTKFGQRLVSVELVAGEGLPDRAPAGMPDPDTTVRSDPHPAVPASSNVFAAEFGITTEQQS